MKRIKMIALALTLSLLTCAYSSTSDVFAEKKKAGGTGSGAASKCQVTSGPNKGKTGTFTENGGWCEGSWGGTECKDSGGKDNGKCKAALTRPQIQTRPATGGVLKKG